MKTLIVEDDFTSRLLLQEFLRECGASHVAVNGREAVEAFLTAQDAGEPYDLVCLDIMMPEMDGQETLKRLRAAESESGIPAGDGAKVIMTTALGDGENVMAAFREQCDAYLVKPIDKAKLLDELHRLRLTP